MRWKRTSAATVTARPRLGNGHGHGKGHGSATDTTTATATAAATPTATATATATPSSVDQRWRLHLPKEFRRVRFGIQPELYDLEADPDERHPVDDPVRIEEMTKLIRAWEQAHAPVSLGGALDQSTIDTLRSLGYGGEVERKNLPPESDR